MLGDAKACHMALSTMGPSAGGPATATLAQATNHLCLQGHGEQQRLQPWLWIEETGILATVTTVHGC